MTISEKRRPDSHTHKMKMAGRAASEFIENHRKEYETLYQAGKKQGLTEGKPKKTGAWCRTYALKILKKLYPEEWDKLYKQYVH